MLNKGIRTCRDLGDNGSEDLLRHILKAEEEHVDWLEAQFDLIAQVGEANYLSQQSHRVSSGRSRKASCN